MKTRLTICSLIFALGVLPLVASPKEKRVAKLVQKTRRAKLARISEFSSLVVKGDRLSMMKAIMIEKSIVYLYGTEITNRTALGRQRFVKTLIGEENYDTLSQYYSSDLESGNIADQIMSLRVLGGALFFPPSTNAIKRLVFSSDSLLQFRAIKSLVYLGVAGNARLLKNYIRAGDLDKVNVVSGLHALYVDNHPQFEEICHRIAITSRSPYEVIGALEYLEHYPNFGLLVSRLLLVWADIPRKPRNSYRYRPGLQSDLLWFVYRHFKEAADPSSVLNVVRGFSELDTSNHYVIAIFILAKFGTKTDRAKLRDMAAKLDPKQNKARAIAAAFRDSGHALKIQPVEP